MPLPLPGLPKERESISTLIFDEAKLYCEGKLIGHVKSVCIEPDPWDVLKQITDARFDALESRMKNWYLWRELDYSDYERFGRYR